MHSGTAARGLAHPNTKHGRFSKDIPARILADYEQALNDPELIALREESALLASREVDLTRRLDSREAGVLWRSAQEALADFRAAQRANDAPGAAAALRDMDVIFGEGVADYLAWNELLRVIEQRRKVADTERRRLEALENSITRRQAMLLSAAMQDTLRQLVDDPDLGIAPDKRTKFLARFGLGLGGVLAAHGAVPRDGDGDD